MNNDSGGGGEVTTSTLRDAVETAANRSLVRLFPKFGAGDNANWGKVQDNLARAIEATMIDQGNAKQHLDEAGARSKRLIK